MFDFSCLFSMVELSHMDQALPNYRNYITEHPLVLNSSMENDGKTQKTTSKRNTTIKITVKTENDLQVTSMKGKWQCTQYEMTINRKTTKMRNDVKLKRQDKLKRQLEKRQYMKATIKKKQ